MPISSRMRMAPLWMRSTPSCVERLDRPVAVFRNSPGRLMDGGSAGALAIPRPPAGATPAPLCVFSRLGHCCLSPRPALLVARHDFRYLAKH